MTTDQIPPSQGFSRPAIDNFANDAEAIHRMRLYAQQELDLARRLREQAQQYHQEMMSRARSEAQQLVLKARLQTRREVDELVRKTREEIQKVLADIRIIRITAQEELAAQRKFTDAARLCSMATSVMPRNDDSPDGQGKKPVSGR